MLAPSPFKTELARLDDDLAHCLAYLDELERERSLGTVIKDAEARTKTETVIGIIWLSNRLHHVHLLRHLWGHAARGDENDLRIEKGDYYTPGHRRAVADTQAYVRRWLGDDRPQKVWTAVGEIIGAAIGDIPPSPIIDFQSWSEDPNFVAWSEHPRQKYQYLMVAPGGHFGAGEFVRTVMEFWFKAWSSVHHATKHQYSRHAASLMSRKLPKGSSAELADYLEAVSDDLLLLSDMLRDTHPEVTREGSDSIRARKLFAQQLADFFHALCGQWRDEENKILTEITFSCELSLDQIREMRRGAGRRRRVGTEPTK